MHSPTMSVAILDRASSPRPDLEPAARSAPSSWVRRLISRFALLAFGLFHLPLIPNDYPTLGGGGFRPDGLSRAWGEVFGQVGLWVARHIFGRTGPMPEGLSGDNGDTAEEYGRLLVAVVVAAIAAAIWTAADRRRPRARWVEPALHLLLRYAIALGLASYAIAKLYPVQFGTLSRLALETRVGELHPMGLLWRFMEYSQPYSVFAGAMELAVVLLLSFRRTSTLGALLCLPVLANVALMNFCYSVPVKLFSTSMVVSAAVLVLYDARRILGALGLGPVLPRAVEPVLSRRAYLVGWGLKIVLIGGVIASSVYDMRRLVIERADRPVSPVEGTWRVQSFVTAGRDLAQTAEPARWRRLVVDAGRAAIRFEDERLERCTSQIDDAAHTLTLDCARIHQAGTLHWARHGDTVQLDGTFDHAPVTVVLQRLDEAQLRLLSTRFEWTFD